MDKRNRNTQLHVLSKHGKLLLEKRIKKRTINISQVFIWECWQLLPTRSLDVISSTNQ